MLSNKNLNIHQQIIRFRFFVFVFFISLSIPLCLIVYYGYEKFENETLLQYSWKANNATIEINKILSQRLVTEQERSPLDYFYNQTSGDPMSIYSSDTSSLARNTEPHYAQDLHGLIGFFNIHDGLHFNSPLLPFNSLNQNLNAELSLSETEIKNRLKTIEELQQILRQNKMLPQSEKVNIEQGAFAVNHNDLTQISTFQLQETPHHQLIFTRNARINQRNVTQGFALDKSIFLNELIQAYIRRAAFDQETQVQLLDENKASTALYFRYTTDTDGNPSVTVSDKPVNALENQELFTGQLISPFQNLSINFTTNKVSLGPATNFVVLFIVVLSIVIIVGTIGFYWIGVKQIALAEQRMNFVSSVSHELKTPLTSILMYSEMLKFDLVTDKQKQRGFYDFIFSESERLSRLINNVLQLSNLNRNQELVKPEFIEVGVLASVIQSKVSTLLEKNKFKLNIDLTDDITKEVKAQIDLDAFSQIMINLIDNAIKFFNAAGIDDESRQKVDIKIGKSLISTSKLKITVRDYGPGISGSQLDKIFELFYRCGNELTRTTSGTGIGLALVYKLVVAQGGEIQVLNQQPGTAFELTFAKQ